MKDQDIGIILSTFCYIYKVKPHLLIFIAFLLLLKNVESQPCKASFIVSENYFPCPQAEEGVIFENESTGDSLSSIWIVTNTRGDTLNLSYDSTLIAFFPAAGIYNAELIIYNSGCRDSVTIDSAITVLGPTGQILVSADSGCSPLSITITEITEGAVYSTLIDGCNMGFWINDALKFFDTVSYNIMYTLYAADTCLPQLIVRDTANCNVDILGPTITVLNCDTVTRANDLTGNFSSFTIYPNPCADYVRLQDENNTSNKQWLFICNPLGQIVYSQNLNNYKGEEIDVRKLVQGFYFVYISEGMGIQSMGKLIKQDNDAKNSW